MFTALAVSGPRRERKKKTDKKKERLLKLSLQITTVRTKEQQSWRSLKAGSRV